MNKYRLSRAEAIELLTPLEETIQTYKELYKSGRMKEAEEHLQVSEPTCTENIRILSYDQRMQTVIESEPKLQERYAKVSNFWVFALKQGLLSQKWPLPQADTTLPPEPSNEITGATTLDYVTTLRGWLDQQSDLLWGDEDNPLVPLPEIGKRYLIGDFGHAHSIAMCLSEGMQVRAHWEALSNNGEENWNSFPICAARAKLLHKGLHILEGLITRVPDMGPIEL